MARLSPGEPVPLEAEQAGRTAKAPGVGVGEPERRSAVVPGRVGAPRTSPVTRGRRESRRQERVASVVVGWSAPQPRAAADRSLLRQAVLSVLPCAAEGVARAGRPSRRPTTSRGGVAPRRRGASQQVHRLRRWSNRLVSQVTAVSPSNPLLRRRGGGRQGSPDGVRVGPALGPTSDASPAVPAGAPTRYPPPAPSHAARMPPPVRVSVLPESQAPRWRRAHLPGAG